MESSILKFFEFKHLPEHLQMFSIKFHDLAHDMDENIPDSIQKREGMQRLLEAKDCFVRANL